MKKESFLILMPFEYMQEDTREWTGKYAPQYWPPHEMFTRLSEEIGELAEEVEQKGKGVGEELSDIIFTITCMANSHDIRLDKEWKTYIQEKYVDAGKQYQQNITFERFFGDIHQDVRKLEVHYPSPEKLVMQLSVKQGRLAREVNHLYGNKKKKSGEEENSFGRELSDILFTVTCIANKYDIMLDKEWDTMLDEKMYGRDKERYVKKSTSEQTE